jgi:hypothetical protein
MEPLKAKTAGLGSLRADAWKGLDGFTAAVAGYAVIRNSMKIKRIPVTFPYENFLTMVLDLLSINGCPESIGQLSGYMIFPYIPAAFPPP